MSDPLAGALGSVTLDALRQFWHSAWEHHGQPPPGIPFSCAFAALLQPLMDEIKAMKAALEQLTAEVAKNADVTASAITLLVGLREQLDQAVIDNDLSAVDRLAKQLDEQTAALAAAVTANTVPAPAPEPAAVSAPAEG